MNLMWSTPLQPHRRLFGRQAGAIMLALLSLCTASHSSVRDEPVETPAAHPGADAEASMRIFRGLRPKVTIEVAERDINEYLRQHPEDFAIPSDFGAPRVAFRAGEVEVSARTKVLFVSSRVSVGMTPQVVDGRLHLVARKVRASGIPLPTFLEGGIADTVAQTINHTLETNGLQLLGVVVESGLVRLTTQAQPSEPD